MSEKESCVTKLVSQLCRSWLISRWPKGTWALGTRLAFTHIYFIRRMKQERLRRETQEKYERSLCTPAGLKTFRLQPSIDNTSIMKVLFFLGVGGLLPHMGYIGMCGRRGYGVSAVLVINMVRFLYSNLHMGMILRRSYVFIIIEKKINKIPSNRGWSPSQLIFTVI